MKSCRTAISSSRKCAGKYMSIVSLLRNIRLDQTLDDDDIAPHTVELAVFVVDADFAKATSGAQFAAGGVLDEDARDELPVPGLLRRVDQRQQRHAACSRAALLAPDIRGALGDAVIALPGSIGRGRAEGDYAILVLHNDNRVNAIEPLGDIFGRARARLKRADAVFDTLVVDGGDGCRVTGCGRTRVHSIETLLAIHCTQSIVAIATANTLRC